jgi:hypothetical protein
MNPRSTVYSVTHESRLYSTSRNPNIIDKRPDYDRISYTGRVKVYGIGSPVFEQNDAIEMEKAEVNMFDRVLGYEITEVCELLRNHSIIILEGDLGEGKSEILVKVCQRTQHNGGAAIKIEGHENKFFTPSHFAAMCEWALLNGAIITIDSADYLVMQSKKFGRNLPMEAHEQRTREIIDLIFRYSELGIKFILTSHNDDWLAIRADDELRQKYLDPVISAAHAHKVRMKLTSPSDISDFYHGFDDFITLPVQVQDFLTVALPNILNSSEFNRFISTRLLNDLRSLYISLTSDLSADQHTNARKINHYHNLANNDVDYFVQYFINEQMKGRFHKLIIRALIDDSDLGKFIQSKVVNLNSLASIYELVYSILTILFSQHFSKMIGKPI